jgi:hypothetical protein
MAAYQYGSTLPLKAAVLKAASAWGVPPDTIFPDMSRKAWFYYWYHATAIEQQARKASRQLQEDDD